MAKKHRQRFKGRNRFRFETPLPAEMALQRLHDLLPREVWGLQRRPLYQVSCETLDDTIYFGVREHVRDSRAKRPAT